MTDVDTEAIEHDVDHRPWPLPKLPWVLFQSWCDLLFAHWPVPADTLRPHVPGELELDTHEGQAWVGITPFRIEDFRPRSLPALPHVSEFPELNLRTYVRARGKPGIHFFSLDAASRAAVVGARAVFRLPYRHAEMEIEETDSRIRFRSQRPDGRGRLEASYAPTDHAFTAAPGSLEHFLTERYALFTVLRDGEILQAEIHHRPWPLQPAEAEITVNQLAAAEGVPLSDSEGRATGSDSVALEAPLLHFSRRQDTLIWSPTPLR